MTNNFLFAVYTDMLPVLELRIRISLIPYSILHVKGLCLSCTVKEWGYEKTKSSVRPYPPLFHCTRETDSPGSLSVSFYSIFHSITYGSAVYYTFLCLWLFPVVPSILPFHFFLRARALTVLCMNIQVPYVFS